MLRVRLWRRYSKCSGADLPSVGTCAAAGSDIGPMAIDVVNWRPSSDSIRNLICLLVYSA